MEYCMICERIDWIKNGKNPYFVKELSTGYVVIGDHQRINFSNNLSNSPHNRDFRSANSSGAGKNSSATSS